METLVPNRSRHRNERMQKHNTTAALPYKKYDTYMRLINCPAHYTQCNGNELSSLCVESDFFKMYISVKLNIIITYSYYYYMFIIHIVIMSPIFDLTHNILLFVKTSQCHHGGVSMSRCHFTSWRIPIIKKKDRFVLIMQIPTPVKCSLYWKRTYILSMTEWFQWSQQISYRIYCLTHKLVSNRVTYLINPQRARTKHFPSIMI